VEICPLATGTYYIYKKENTMNSPLTPIVQFLRDVNELKVAESLLDVFAKYSDNIGQFDEIAKYYMDIKRYRKAISLCETALGIANPQQAYSVRINLGKLYNNINYPEKSVSVLEINEKLNPKDLDVKLEKMFSLFLLNRKEESKDLLQKIMNDPTANEKQVQTCKFNMGTYDLYDGKFKEGMKGFLVEGKKLGIWKDKIEINLPQWDGEIDGSEIVIMGQGGIGDEVINVRFMKNLQDLGMKPIWLTNFSGLKTVFDRNGFKTITSIKDIPKTCKYQTYAMTLPIFLDLDENEVWNGPYLTANPSFVEKHKDIKRPGVISAGVKWSGNPEYDQDLHREIKIEDLITVFPFSVELYSIQKENYENAEQFFEDCFMKNLADRLITFEDTLGIIENLDIVVTSCTSIAHLAGALGKRTIVIVPITAYYTWCSRNDTTSNWYGENLTVLRQVKTRSWEEPIQQLKEILVQVES
jgi:tetratricopeptide (TPR) repeat protein